MRGVWVVVPAHDEEKLIEACIDSIRIAAARVPLWVEVTVVLDACTDSTADRIPSWVRSVEVAYRNAGEARSSGLRGAPAQPGVWYATTDADSLVPPNWFQGVLDSAQQGYDVRVGTILVSDWGGRDACVRERHDRGYRQRARHGHIHGANLALAATAYHAVGGFRGLAEHEDVDLVTRCVAAGLWVDWSATTPVTTSARRHNRVPNGFAALLDALEEEPLP